MKKYLSMFFVATLVIVLSVAYADMKTLIQKRASTTYDAVTVTDVTVNTSIETGKQIVLAYMEWNRDNSKETSQKMIRMYSDDIAAYITGVYEDCERICVFWELPKMYKKDGQPDAKVMYDCKGNDAYFHSSTGDLFY